MSVSTSSFYPANLHSTMMPSMKVRARRSPSSSEGSSIGASTTPDPSKLPHKQHLSSTVKVLVVDQQQKTGSTSTKKSIPTMRTIRAPPHKDWYSFKPIPRAPLPLYHPLRVSKPRPQMPQSMSAVLPQPRSRPVDSSATNPSNDANQVATRTSTRTRRQPTRLRDLGMTGSGAASPTTSLSDAEKEKEKEDETVQQQPIHVPPPKPKRHRRTKAEIAAAKAAAAAAAAAEGLAEDGAVIVTPRRKRKRAGDVNINGEGGDNGEAEAEATPKRRRRGNAVNEVTSNYGTRSRSNANGNNTRATNSANASAEKEEGSNSPSATGAGPSARGRSMSTSASTVEMDESNVAQPSTTTEPISQPSNNEQNSPNAPAPEDVKMDDAL